jgi:hypothetical protein
MEMTDFDMPPVSAGFPARGRWLIDHLSADLEISENQAAGIVGNLAFESGGLMTLQEITPVAGRGGRGWAMWTSSRRVAFESWADNRKIDPDSNEANYGYLLVELRGAYKGTIDALRQKESVTNSVWSVGQTYERPGGTTPEHLPGFQSRLTYAMRALAGPSVVAAADPGSSAPPVLAPVAEPAYLAAVLLLEAPERKLVQQGLAWAKLYSGAIDGIIGPLSRAALDANRKQG